MLQRLVRTFAVLLLIVGASAFVIVPSADAEVNCDLVLDPFVERDDGFNPFFTGATVTGSDLLRFAGGDTDRAIADAQSVLRNTTLPAGVRPFYEQALLWFTFEAAGTCADAVAYPGPFENIPTTPETPYGFTLNPTVASSFNDSVPAVAAAAAPAAPASGALAHTGSETEVLVYFGAGLLGFGALALGSRRRFL